MNSSPPVMSELAAGYQNAGESLWRLGVTQMIFGVLFTCLCGAVAYFGYLIFDAGPMEDENGTGPPFPGLSMLVGVVIAGVALGGVVLGLGSCASALAIMKRRFRRFSLVVAYLTCAVFPLAPCLVCGP